jgi:meiosis arrest female protein 1
MGHKRIFVSFMKDKTSAECSALRNKVIGLLRDVPAHTLQMCKFRELFQSRFKSSISILDLYKMSDIVDITVRENDEKSISLKSEYMSTLDYESSKQDQAVAPYSTYCVYHYKPDKNKGWAEIEIDVSKKQSFKSL